MAGASEATTGTDDARVLLHIGAPKTGTTAVQGRLASARARLLDLGVLYPGTTHSHVTAMRAPLDWPVATEQRSGDRRRWRRLLTEVEQHRGRVVVSAETLATADDEHARAIVESFGGANVEVVVTLRSIDQIMPSAWQEDVKAGSAEQFSAWLDAVCDGPRASPPHRFWIAHDHGAIVERWAAVVGAGRITVVVVDPSRPEHVVNAFERLIGLADGALAGGHAVPANRSLTASECEVLRRFNEGIGEGRAPSPGRRGLPPRAVWHMLDGRTPGPDERRLRVPVELIERVRPFAADIVARVRAVGPTVVGSLDDLIPAPPDEIRDASPGPNAYPADTVPIDAAALLLEGVLLAASDDPQ